MKKQVIKLMTILSIALSVVACKKDSSTSIDKTNDGSFKVYSEGNVTYVQNLVGDSILGINATTGQPYGSGKFTFFSLVNGTLVSNADSATNNWDIAVRGTTILTNAGTSGPGNGGAYVQVGTYADVTAVSPDSTFRTDAAPVYAIRTGSNKGWYVYDGANNLITAIPGRVLVIRTANGKYAKLEITNYYRGGATPAATASDAIKLSEQRYYNFRYTYQANGSTTF